MARIVLHSMAHRGDVFPYVPIGAELARRGHDVDFVVPREFHPLFAEEPFRCTHSGTDFGPAALDDHGEFIARWGMRLAGSGLMRLYFGRFTVPHLDALFTAVDDALADADLLVSHPATSIIGAMSCERRGIPWIVGDLFPMVVPTATAPPAGIPDLGPRANRLAWRVGRSRLGGPATSRRHFVAHRRHLGLATRRGWNAIDDRLSPHLNLALVSPHYVDVAEDWPDNYEVVGFTHWAGPGRGRLPHDVIAYLADGAAPILVTLGTSGASARPEVFGQIAELLDERGERGIFLTSNPTVTAHVRETIDRRHGVWQFVPLGPLLRHVRAVVHSGAHGTNSMVLAAGLPSVIVPCMFDQLWHARRQETLGTGIAARHRRHLRPAIDRLLHDPSITDNARRIGRSLAGEDGTAVACDAIDRFLAENVQAEAAPAGASNAITTSS